jgi:gamma-glutamyltranspeptidase
MLAWGARGAVVSPHHLASEAGLGVLRAGGSAVDAAIATNAALAVVAGYACGLGGDALWLIWDMASERLDALNGTGRAPAASDRRALRANGVHRMPIRGPLSITIPGAIRSWGDAHLRHGRLPRSAVLGPAIELAADGFAADSAFIGAVERAANTFDAALGPAAAGFHATYRPHARPWALGERVRLPALAATLRRIADAGFDDAYEGDLALRQSRALNEAGSSIGLDDLRTHTSTWTKPISVDYRGTHVTSHPPNSSGVVALEILSVLGRFEPPPPDVFSAGNGGASAGPDARWLHLTLEATKRAFADRDATLTDPEFHDVDVERLLSGDYAAELAAGIDESEAARPLASTAPRGGGTISLSVADGDGNVVSLIESNYMGFGSGIVDPQTGIAYQNRGSYFSLHPRHANVLAPGKRTLHTLVPWMAFRAGRPWVVGGSMGGDAQPAICAQVISGLVDGRLDVAAAVAAPRAFPEPEAHFEPPDRVTIEPRFRLGLLEELASRGHRLRIVGSFDSSLGHCHAIEVVNGGPAVGGTLAAATDPRSLGVPATW